MEIISNGSHWAGEDPDSVEQLLAVLAKEPLDPTFERYGNFCFEDHVWGNFHAVSHVFNIYGTPDELAPLVKAIRANQATKAYRQAKRMVRSRR